MTLSSAIGTRPEETRGLIQRNKWLIARRLSQGGFLALFLLGPLAGIWIVKGNLTSSLTLETLPLTDPYILLQSLAAGHLPELTALMGALIVAGVYAIIGGRVYCSWVCPINPITDFAGWLHGRLGLRKGWQPKRSTRVWLLVTTFILSAITATIAWEIVNPVSMLHRGIIFGMGAAWTIVVAVFLFDLLLSHRGWCGHLCPVGAFYGQLGAKSILRISAARRTACNDCMDCFRACPEPHIISPALKGSEGQTPVILSKDCTNCVRCIDVCDQNVFRFALRWDERTEAEFVARTARPDSASILENFRSNDQIGRIG